MCDLSEYAAQIRARESVCPPMSHIISNADCVNDGLHGRTIDRRDRWEPAFLASVGSIEKRARMVEGIGVLRRWQWRLSSREVLAKVTDAAQTWLANRPAGNVTRLVRRKQA